jgi:hypothetical protein
MIPSTLLVRQLDGSYIKAAGSGVVIIRPPGWLSTVGIVAELLLTFGATTHILHQ